MANGRRGSRGRRQNRSRTTRTREILPVPRAIKNLPNDMPSINPTFRRTVNILWTDTTAAGSISLTYTKLLALIREQCFGNTTLALYYFINSIRAWGPAGDSTSLSITDSSYKTSSFDTGSFAFRPKVGLYFPATVRPVHFATSTGDICLITTDPEESNVSVLINVTVWSAASPDF